MGQPWFGVVLLGRIRGPTVDLLAQIPYCEAISAQLRNNARAALKAINRFPVCEPIDLLAGGAGLNPATARASLPVEPAEVVVPTEGLLPTDVASDAAITPAA